MSDVKPKRTPRESGQREISSGEAVPNGTPLAKPLNEPPLAEVVSARPDSRAEPAPEIVAAIEPQADSVDDSWTAFVAVQAVLARGLEEIFVEAAGTTRTGIAAAADASVALLGVKTFSEAVEINAALARRAVDAMIEGAVRLSEIGVKAVSEASRPVLSQFHGTWSGLVG
jgi:hypothetical protein